jgi:hypothetical protein
MGGKREGRAVCSDVNATLGSELGPEERKSLSDMTGRLSSGHGN